MSPRLGEVSGLGIVDALGTGIVHTDGIIASRAEPSRAEPSRAEPSRAEARTASALRRVRRSERGHGAAGALPS